MILKSIYEYVQQAGRVEESALLKHFHLRQAGLDALIAPLMRSGKVQKSVHQRGEQLTPIIYYSTTDKQQIPALTIV